MALDDILRKGVALVNTVTSSLQDTVTLAAWTGSGSYGPTYAAAVSYQACIDTRQALRRLSSGQEVMARAVVQFLTPITPNGASGRAEPIDPRDILTLPDGSTGPILDVAGYNDPDTNAPFAAQVVLG